jgi:hypothetical protein
MGKTKKQNTRIFDRKPSKLFYDPETEYPARSKSGKWVIHKYSFVARKPTAYQKFQKEFGKYLRQNEIDASEYGGFAKLSSEFWRKEKAKYGFTSGSSKKNEKAKEVFEGALNYGQIEIDIYDIFTNRKGGGEVVEKMLKEIELDIPKGWWYNDLVFKNLDYYGVDKKFVAVLYDENGKITGLKLVESEEDRKDVKDNAKAYGEKLHDTTDGYATNSVAYDDLSDAIIEFLPNFENVDETLKEHFEKQGLDLHKELMKIGIYSRKMTKEEKLQMKANEITLDLNNAMKSQDYAKVQELSKQLTKVSGQIEKLKK